MKKMTPFLLLISLFISSQSFGQEKQYKIIVAGFYNLENFFDTIDDPKTFDNDFTPKGDMHYTADIYFDKIKRLEEVVSQIGTDISPDGLAFWGTAEIENKEVVEALVSQPKLKSRNYQVVHYNGGDPRSIDCGFVYNPKYFKLLKSHSIPIDLSKAVKDGKPTRDVLWVTGILNATDTMDIFIGHWPSRRGGEELTAPMRNYVAKTIKQHTDSIIGLNPNAKVIVMGDLNDNPTDESLIKILQSVDKKEKIKPLGFYNPWISYYNKGIGTLAHNDSWGLFDQIILSKGFLDTKQSGYFYYKANIFNKDFMIQKTGKYKGYPKRTWDFNIYNSGYSDHFPTYITLLKEIKE
ncbi:MAG TPA: endonuclease/exonuclease/phosphatase [Chitinophagales bacterium]|nr:endonuclease/exonuclease/phosphatase [Chitinophagales bacterium]HMW13601.1 endonuclease/exonuclease/phosphatase [Chitinophagales bacterium]HMX61149.1 endonuclease/exonuclease/phosphatase [Chitinophagales bacterium]HMY24131.1 endonuclease/exonuclease/phosphatase [Chitinophagales bacterium]HMZ34706.1 endonuclease/exonuclease/phosphatase [Chitinophagales bacterium]